MSQCTTNDSRELSRDSGVKLFSKAWWLGILTAYFFWKYSARDAAVSTVSTINTTFQFTVGGAVLSWLSSEFPNTYEFFVQAKEITIAVLLACWDILTLNF
jgi:hypothetical protein